MDNIKKSNILLESVKKMIYSNQNDEILEKIQKNNENNDENNENLKLINNFTKRKFSSDEIYIFSVLLCDNEIDRTYDMFSDNAFEKLSNLFIGKTGIMDHNLKSGNQIARIFDTVIEIDQTRKNYIGMPYRRLIGKAYLPRSESNKDIILSLDAGIKKEVSIHCAVKDHICSICKCNIKNCGHLKAHIYNGLLCYGIIDNPVDAYEWSFVVVPAQRNAGVIKSFDFIKKFKNVTDLNLIDLYKKNVEKTPEIDKNLKNDIKKEIISYLYVTENFKIGSFIEKNLISKLDNIELEEYKNLLSEKIIKMLPVNSQLSLCIENDKCLNNEFKI